MDVITNIFVYSCSEQERLIPTIQTIEAKSLARGKAARHFDPGFQPIWLLENAGGTTEALDALLDRVSSAAVYSQDEGELLGLRGLKSTDSFSRIRSLCHHVGGD